MNTMKKYIEGFKKPLLTVAVFLILYIGVAYVLPFINSQLAEHSPIIKINAENEKIYSSKQELRAEDFDVTAEHENGKTSKVSSKDIVITGKHKRYGKVSKVKVSLKEDSSITCTVPIKNQRKKLESIACGSPHLQDVKAVIYSNGELCFEGKGDISQYTDGNFPWQNSEIADSIRYITWEDGVTPTSLDYYFSGMESISYVENIPSSVISMVGTFQGCIQLKSAPDWTSCKGLLDISNCYEGCESLIKVPAIPASVYTITNAFLDCIMLQDAPDMSKATGVRIAISAFEGCERLVKIALPPNVEDISNMMAGCINLKEMPEIPEPVVNMNGTFQGNTSMMTLTILPSKVANVSSCFQDCSKIRGVLWVDANPKESNGCFEGAAVATKVDLQGNSLLMDVLANTGTNITVNGKTPDPEITSYEELLEE